MKLCPELMPVLRQLQAEGYEVYTYKPLCGNEYHSLFWFEAGRVLNIQPNTWRNERYARDVFDIGVSYIPSRENGSGCGLSSDDCGTSASELLKYRHNQTWVRGVKNYRDMAHYLKDGLRISKALLNSNGEA